MWMPSMHILWICPSKSRERRSNYSGVCLSVSVRVRVCVSSGASACVGPCSHSSCVSVCGVAHAVCSLCLTHRLEFPGLTRILPSILGGTVRLSISIDFVRVLLRTLSVTSRFCREHDGPLDTFQVVDKQSARGVLRRPSPCHLAFLFSVFF